MHNFHVVMASLNSPMAEFFPPVDVEVGNELFWYIFKGEPMPKDGFIDLDENTPGLGLTGDEPALKNFKMTERTCRELLLQPPLKPGPHAALKMKMPVRKLQIVATLMVAMFLAG